jgi:hypothetical protein
MTSANPGIDPVVMAFRRGEVTVGGATYAVKGIAEPSLINLQQQELAKNQDRIGRRSIHALG